MMVCRPGRGKPCAALSLRGRDNFDIIERFGIPAAVLPQNLQES
jgi:hypothetical protein